MSPFRYSGKEAVRLGHQVKTEVVNENWTAMNKLLKRLVIFAEDGRIWLNQS